MTELRLIQVDAFADAPFTGNPAAVMPLDAWLPDATLQAIAQENNLSETAFTVPDATGESDYELRWFTPTVEIAMCGHATLATGHVLIGDREALHFRTRKAGVLSVERDGNALTLDLPAIPVRSAGHPVLAAALGVPDAEIFMSFESHQATAIALLSDEFAVRACDPDMKALSDLALMAIITAPGDGADIVSRVFVPAWGVDEDPVTGSAHAALTPFWATRLGRDRFTAFQASRRGGHVDCRQAENRVRLGGRCVTVIEGAMRF